MSASPGGQEVEELMVEWGGQGQVWVLAAVESESSWEWETVAFELGSQWEWEMLALELRSRWLWEQK